MDVFQTTQLVRICMYSWDHPSMWIFFVFFFAPKFIPELMQIKWPSDTTRTLISGFFQQPPCQVHSLKPTYST